MSCPIESRCVHARLWLSLAPIEAAAWRLLDKGEIMLTNGGTAPANASQSVAWGPAPANREALARTLLELCAQGAVLFSTWFLF
jgi:hypothetical protein